MKFNAFSYLLALLFTQTLPAIALEPSASPIPQPSPEATTIYRLEASSPEFLALLQVPYPLGLGYFLQDEAELGGYYTALQGGMLLAGTLWGSGMGGSSWTQLLPNLSLGLWLMSLSHVDALARAKNAQLAQQLGLNPGQIRGLMGAYPFSPDPLSLPLPRWEPKLAVALLLDASGQVALAPGPGLQVQYPLGIWLKTYTGESWLEQLDLSLDLQGFWPVWESSPAAMSSNLATNQNSTGMSTRQTDESDNAPPALNLRRAPGFSSSLGLLYRTPTEPWSFYFGGGWTTLWRSSLFTASGGSEQASWQGVNALGGLSFRQADRIVLNLGLDIGLFNFSGSTSSMGELPTLLRFQPFVSGSFQF